MDFDIVNRNSSEVTVRRRKKREKENKKSIFEIYRSEKTMKDYLFYLNDFLLFVYDSGEPIQRDEIVELMSDITEEDVEDYLSHLLYERNLKKTSVNKIISALKSLYNELEKHGIKNPFKFVKLFKTARNIDNILKVSFEDIKNILNTYKVNGEKEYRNTIISSCWTAKALSARHVPTSTNRRDILPPTARISTHWKKRSKALMYSSACPKVTY